ncbi:hypothetical protein MRX96_005550 [Rhipicephalus microplus]
MAPGRKGTRPGNPFEEGIRRAVQIDAPSRASTAPPNCGGWQRWSPSSTELPSNERHSKGVVMAAGLYTVSKTETTREARLGNEKDLLSGGDKSPFI